jgi:cysteinyl-tRNA synthetase
MSLSGTGKLIHPSTCGGGSSNGSGGGHSHHHPWSIPEIDTSSPIASGHLLLLNTLTGTKVPFVPMHARHVKWYTCGPTVYDSSHIGHARTYLSLDIMRRIMSDYFHYNVLYQINTTDIDDKIILRARQNELLRQLEADTSVDYIALVALVKEALIEAKTNSENKKLQLQTAIHDATSTGNTRVRIEQEGLLTAHEYKRKNLDVDEVNILNAINNSSNDDTITNDDDAAQQQQSRRANLFKLAKTVLAEKLDREKGHLITDHDVFNSHSRYYENEFMSDMDALGIRRPDVLTRVTEYIPQIITFISKIITNNMAYVSNGSVYLSLDAFQDAGHNYRKCKPAGGGGAGGTSTSSTTSTTSAAEMAEGEGALSSPAMNGEKRNPNDFVLWKSSKAGEPAWESPFGPGRPGWHIECSVVAGDILGENIDIHSGGEDLKFPHHDNELAQSEACFGCGQWVNYFTHTGHLHIEGLKMSKSLKNFITIRQALEHSTARQLRIMFLLQAWDQPMSYSDQSLDDARSKEMTFRSYFREVEALVRTNYLQSRVGWRMGDLDHKLADSYLCTRQTVHESLLDNFNTKDAMLALLKIINEANAYLRTPGILPSTLTLQSIAVYVTQILKVFGVVTGSDDFGFGSSSSSGVAGESSNGKDVVDGTGSESYISAMVTFRESVRNAALEAAKSGGGTRDDAQTAAIQSILQICDGLRDNVLPTLGVRLEDRPTGTMWNLEDPAVMLREMAEKSTKEKEIQINKIEKQLIARTKELDKVKSSMIKPEDLFRTDEYKEWDNDGAPITFANGDAVSGGQVKKKKKVIEKQAKAYQDLMEKSGNNPQELLDLTQKEVDALKSKLSELSM